jgi:hypothetical protein
LGEHRRPRIGPWAILGDLRLSQTDWLGKLNDQFEKISIASQFTLSDRPSPNHHNHPRNAHQEDRRSIVVSTASMHLIGIALRPLPPSAGDPHIGVRRYPILEPIDDTGITYKLVSEITKTYIFAMVLGLSNAINAPYLW